MHELLQHRGSVFWDSEAHDAMPLGDLRLVQTSCIRSLLSQRCSQGTIASPTTVRLMEAMSGEHKVKTELPRSPVPFVSR